MAEPSQHDPQHPHRNLSASRYPWALRRVSATESPPNFSSTASASTSATIASATIPAAGTAQTSERWWWATASSPVATSTVRSARGTVAIGFMAARTRSTSPVDMPPSVPPERPEVRRSPSSVVTISSCASEPGVSASSNPSPTSTPLIAWMPISAPASLASRRRSQCTWEPRPGGRPWTTTSTTPPRVSPSLWAWSMAATIAAAASGSRQRTGSSSRRATSSGSGQSPAGARTPPSSTTWETMRAPTACSRKFEATRPSATRAAVSRAEARSRIGRASSKSYFCMPARSACPGRGRVREALRASASSSTGSTGSADMTFSHLGHSVLPTSIATGPPRVVPWRTPPTIVTSSCSNFIRAPRPYPSRRRARESWMSAVVTFTWAGSPSRIATRDGPWDSPAVSQRSMRPVFHDRSAAEWRPSADEMAPDRRSGNEPDQGAGQHRRAEWERRAEQAPVTAGDGQREARQPEDEERGVGADHELAPAQVGELEPEQRRQAHVAEAHARRADEPQHPEDRPGRDHAEQGPQERVAVRGGQGTHPGEHDRQRVGREQDPAGQQLGPQVDVPQQHPDRDGRQQEEQRPVPPDGAADHRARDRGGGRRPQGEPGTGDDDEERPWLLGGVLHELWRLRPLGPLRRLLGDRVRLGRLRGPGARLGDARDPGGDERADQAARDGCQRRRAPCPREPGHPAA